MLKNLEVDQFRSTPKWCTVLGILALPYRPSKSCHIWWQFGIASPSLEGYKDIAGRTVQVLFKHGQILWACSWWLGNQPALMFVKATSPRDPSLGVVDMRHR